jgi:hypothetical protein
VLRMGRRLFAQFASQLPVRTGYKYRSHMRF